jgi:hypothetical protein
MPSEAEVQAALRLEYARRGYKLWRNNSGVAQYADGRPVRFGLANDSAALNARLKSSDLIGWVPVVITPMMVGETFARFVSLECKPSDWHLTPGDTRGQAQQRWIDLVAADGGEARFVTSAD